MSNLPKSKLSASNMLLLVVCLIVIVAILLLNIINTKNLTQLRQYINTLGTQNTNVEVLRNTSKQLLEAENAYRLYLSTNDTLYSNKYLSHMISCVNDIKALKNEGDSIAINTILEGLEQKIQMSDALDQLKRMSDSIARKKAGGFDEYDFISPYWFKISNNSLLIRYDSLMQQSTNIDNGSRKKLFLKKLGAIFSSKDEKKQAENEIEENQTATSAPYTKVNPLEQAVKDVEGFYAGAYNEFTLRTKINENEKALAQVNLVISYQIDDALRNMLDEEELSVQQKEEIAINNAKQAKKTVSLLSWVSYVIIFFIVLLLVYNIRKGMIYEKTILSAREEAEKLATTKSRFLSNMSHEIRSPLTSIIGFTEQLDNLEFEPDKKRYLQAIRTSSDHLLTTVNDILDFSKLDAGKLSLSYAPFNINKTIDEVLYAFSVSASKKSIQLQSDIQLDEELIVNGDQHRLKQILINLTSNAIKFTDEGAIKISAKSVSATDKEIIVKIDIQDSGVGIPEDQLDLIFQEFAQASNTKKGGRRAIRGTGLGLSICKMLVELQGGTIGVQSILGKGSIFSIEIPFKIDSVKKRAIYAEENTQSKQIGFAGKQALVVEDNEMNIMLLTLLLRKAQIGFDIAKDGEKALQLFEEKQYDIVLTDINIPKLTGDQVAATIRKHADKRKASVPIVALTASIIGDDTDQYFKMGVNKLLIKPFKEMDFTAVLNTYLA